ncbi:hypothetical protein EniLVp02_0149 [Vibrio phage EniLVp02]
MANETVVKISARKFDEFLGRFKQFLDREEDRLNDDQSDDKQSGISQDTDAGFKRLAAPLQALSGAINKLDSAVRQMALTNASGGGDSPSVIQNIQNISNNTEQTANNVEVVWDENATGFTRMVKAQSNTNDILEQIHKTGVDNARALGLNAQSAVEFAKIQNATTPAQTAMITAMDDIRQQVIVSNAINKVSGSHLKRISNDLMLMREESKRGDLEQSDRLGSMVDHMGSVIERIAREEAEQARANRDKDKKDDKKKQTFTRMAFSKLTDIAGRISRTLIDARLLMMFGAIKGFLGKVMAPLGGLFSVFGKGGKGLLGGLFGGAAGGGLFAMLRTPLTNFFTALFNPRVISKFLRVGGPIGLAVGAALELWGEDIFNLLNEVADLITDPERLNVLKDQVIDGIANMWSSLGEMVSTAATQVRDAIVDGINSYVGFWASLGPQLELAIVNMRQVVADKIREYMPDWLGRDTIAGAIEPDNVEGKRQEIQDRINTIKSTDFVGTAINAIDEKYGDELRAAADVVASKVAGLKDAAVEIVTETYDGIVAAKDAVSTGLKQATSAVRDAGRVQAMDGAQKELDRARREAENRKTEINQSNQQQTIQQNNNTFNTPPISPSRDGSIGIAPARAL